MVGVEKKENNFIFEVKGLHKVWALRSELNIPVEHVKTAYINTENLDWARGLRMPGVHIPGLITAGTYLVKDGAIFCDITNDNNCVIVELQDEHYTKLIIEVENPQETVELLTTK